MELARYRVTSHGTWIEGRRAGEKTSSSAVLLELLGPRDEYGKDRQDTKEILQKLLLINANH